MVTLILKDVVQREGMYVEKNATLRELIEVMKKNRKGMAVVLRGGKPVGIMTERDIVEVMHKGIDLDKPAYTLSKKSLVITKEDRTVGHALTMMMENNIRRIIVADNMGNFIGAATQQDLLKHLEEDFYRSFVRVKHILEKQRPLIGAHRDEPMRDILEKMVIKKISSIPVLDGYKAVGIITEKDILGLATRNISLSDPVGKYMSSPVVSVASETTLMDVVKIMNTRNIRRVVINNTDGFPSGVITIRDVLRNLEGDYSHFLERKLKHTKDVLNLFPEALIELTDTGKEQLIIWANERAVNRFGKGILDTPVTELIPSDRWISILETLRANGRTEDIKFKRDENIYEFSGFYVRTEGHIEQGRIQLIVRDITEEVKLATVDVLTNVYNRRFLNDFMVKEIYRSRRTDRKFTVVILDVDDFKKINDTHGHLVGDAVLKHLSELLTNSLRMSDVIGRYGGEEFLLLMPETPKESAFTVVERLRNRLEKEPISLPEGETVKITASFGGATFPEDGPSSEDLLVAADERLYRAKREGKNRVTFS